MAVTTNTWLGATSGQPPLAQQPNSHLGIHKTQFIYAGSQIASQTTAGSGGTASNGTWVAQSFSTGSATTIGRVVLGLSANTALGANLGAMTIGIYANSAGAPTGAALLTVQATAEYVNPGPALMMFPMPLTGLSTSTTYWLVTQPAGNASFQYTWNKSNQASGTSTSTNGTTWTAQAYGSIFQVFDGTITGNFETTWEDNGARWELLYYANPGPEISNIAQYTTSQNGGYQQGYRTFSYVNGLLQTVN
jgi:hypothetical protein